MTATAQPASATYPTVRWQSADERIATVSDDGVITALAPGNTSITARSADGTNLSATCTLTVEEPYYSTLALFGDADGDNVVSDRDIEAVTDLLLGNRGGIDRSCDVNGDGHIGVGDIATIIDLLQNGDVDGEGPEAVDMSISPAKATIVVTEDATCQLAVSFVPHRATSEIIWTSSNPEVATVNVSGLVEARTLGSCIVTATTVDGSLTADVEVDVKSVPFAIIPQNLRLMPEESYQLRVSPTLPVIWSSSNPTVASVSSTGEVKAVADGECVITATWLYGVKAECKIYVLHEWVDLGLSVKWATMNVGASRPEDYGNYFAWGETEPKSTYNMNTYFDSVNGSYSDFKKYNSGAEPLYPKDDAAHVNWGGTWRMPTRAEQGELRNNCTWTWTTQNGVKGYKVTSKSNGNSIFLPAAGYRDEDGLDRAGSDGFYWSSSLGTSFSYYACDLYFGSDSVDWYGDCRCLGLSVRAVCQ